MIFYQKQVTNPVFGLGLLVKIQIENFIIMITVTPLHKHYNPEHLNEVITEMRTRGAPRLRGYQDKNTGWWFMREGTHRLRAAKILGLTPVLIPISWWRSSKSLEQARYAAIEFGHSFPVIQIGTSHKL